MASLNEMDIVSDSVARSLGYISLKSEQKTVIKDFITGNDVFAVLPTGYGKSLCYVCLPGVFDEIFDCTGDLHYCCSNTAYINYERSGLIN